MRDTFYWLSAKLGRPIPFKWPTHFPLHTVLALRVAILEPKTIGPIFEAAWGKDINIGDAKLLIGVLNEAGFDGEALVRGAKQNQNGCKDQLIQNHSEAMSLGMYGVPTFQVNHGHIIFG
jgi:2-hydroxychromene-2-carboxylate isomerase